MALRARKVSWAFEKRVPASWIQLAFTQGPAKNGSNAIIVKHLLIYVQEYEFLRMYGIERRQILKMF